MWNQQGARKEAKKVWPGTRGSVAARLHLKSQDFGVEANRIRERLLMAGPTARDDRNSDGGTRTRDRAEEFARSSPRSAGDGNVNFSAFVYQTWRRGCSLLPRRRELPSARARRRKPRRGATRFATRMAITSNTRDHRGGPFGLSGDAIGMPKRVRMHRCSKKGTGKK